MNLDIINEKNGTWVVCANNEPIDPQPSEIKVEYKDGYRKTILIFDSIKSNESVFQGRARKKEPMILKERYHGTG